MRGNGPTIAWFKDPAGNILSVLEATMCSAFGRSRVAKNGNDLRFFKSARPRTPTSGDASTAIRARPPDPNHRDDERFRDS